MFLIKKPLTMEMERFVGWQKNLPFSYREVGATENEAPPKGDVMDR